MLEYLIPSFLNMEFCYQKVKGVLLSEKADTLLWEDNSAGINISTITASVSWL